MITHVGFFMPLIYMCTINKLLESVSGATSTDKALAFARTESFSTLHGARVGVPKILVVMTDGQSTSPPLTAQEARVLHYSDVKVRVKTSHLANIYFDIVFLYCIPLKNLVHIAPVRFKLTIHSSTSACLSTKCHQM